MMKSPSNPGELRNCTKVFSETDLTEDLKSISVPVLIMHGGDDQIVPTADSALLFTKLVRNATLKMHPGQVHGMCTTRPDLINPDLLAFIKGRDKVRGAKCQPQPIGCKQIQSMQATVNNNSSASQRYKEHALSQRR